MRDLLGFTKLTFELADVTQMDAAKFGKFDVVLVFGLLYHLENPVGALRLARALTREVAVFETQLSPPLSGEVEWGTASSRKRLGATFGAVDETVELAEHNREASKVPISLVPDLEGLLWMLSAVGFARVERVPHPSGAYEQFSRGQRAMVAAWV
jgi:tRNA (mo5U34)-methyltransferase